MQHKSYNPNETVSLNVRNIPRGLRNQFKSLCSEKGVSMQNAVVQLVKKAVVEGKIKVALAFLALSVYGICGETEECKRLSQHFGLQNEVVLHDRSRVDLMSQEYAIEADWTSKWAEAIGQSLYYAASAKKKPGILLIQKGDVSVDLHRTYIARCTTVCELHDIELWTVAEGSNKVIKVYPIDPFQK